MNIELIVTALFGICAAFAGGFGFGWMRRNRDYVALLMDYDTLVDRDARGRFKKSMRVLKDAE